MNLFRTFNARIKCNINVWVLWYDNLKPKYGETKKSYGYRRY